MSLEMGLGPKNLGSRTEAEHQKDLDALKAELAGEDGQNEIKEKAKDIEKNQGEQDPPKLIFGSSEDVDVFQKAVKEETDRQDATRDEAEKNQDDAMDSFLLSDGALEEKESAMQEKQKTVGRPLDVTQGENVGASVEGEVAGEDDRPDKTIDMERNTEGVFESVPVGQDPKVEGREVVKEKPGVEINQESLESYNELIEAQKKYLQTKDETSHLEKIWAKLGSKGNQENLAKVEAAKQALEDKKAEFRKVFGAFGQGLVNGKKLELEKAGVEAGEVKGKLLEFMQTERMFNSGEKDENDNPIMRSISEEYNHRLSELDNVQIESLPSKAKQIFKGAWNIYRKVPPQVRFAATLSVALGIGAATGGLTVGAAALLAGKKFARMKVGAATGAIGAGLAEKAMQGFQKLKDVKQKKTADDLERQAAEEFSISANKGLDTDMDSAVEKGLLAGVEKKKAIMDEINRRQKAQLRNRMIAAGIGGAVAGYGANAFAGDFLDEKLFGGSANDGVINKPRVVAPQDIEEPRIKNPLVQPAEAAELNGRGIDAGEEPLEAAEKVSFDKNKIDSSLVEGLGQSVEGDLPGNGSVEEVAAGVAEKVDSAAENPNVKIFTLNQGDSVWKSLKAEGMTDSEIMNKIGAFNKQIGQQLMEERGMTQQQAMEFINGRFSHMDIGESFSLNGNGEIECESFLSDNKLDQFEGGKWKVEEFKPIEKPSVAQVALNVAEPEAGSVPGSEFGEIDPETKLKDEIALRTGFNSEREGFQHVFQKMPEGFKGNPDLASAYMQIFAGGQEEVGQGIKDLFGLDNHPQWYTDDNGYIVVEDAYGKKGFNLVVSRDSIGVDGPSKWNWGMEKGKLFSERPTAQLDVENIGQAREYIEERSEQLKLGNSAGTEQGQESQGPVEHNVSEKATIADSAIHDGKTGLKAPEIESQKPVDVEAGGKEFEQGLNRSLGDLKVGDSDLERVNEERALQVFRRMRQSLDTTQERNTLDDKSYELMVKMLGNPDHGKLKLKFGDYVNWYSQNRKTPLSKEEFDALANIYKKF